MNLGKLLFGEKIILQDDFFGAIESDRTRSKTSKSLNWYFSAKIGYSKNQTFIISDGNYLGIKPTQKKILKDFVLNFESKYSIEIYDILNKEQHLNMEEWKTDYYISTIHPALNDLEDNFEIIFESSNNTYIYMMILTNDGLGNLLKINK